eukprot:CAMPEP_0180195972 /NCGR_PEP_ID=MMETSP0987-20121128/3870_1 /TAXON_ID=697907 /ORGANISM="non described non described, Strain CCMP2293" /LENGTH=90 /DNA_ID=CAMNT_0022150845 /DNA_START=281 /DNA_END=551 /DNA_ORIENTATION=+
MALSKRGGGMSADLGAAHWSREASAEPSRTRPQALPPALLHFGPPHQHLASGANSSATDSVSKGLPPHAAPAAQEGEKRGEKERFESVAG